MPVGETPSPEVIKQIVRELHSLYVHPIEDVRVIINENNLFDFQAWIYGSTGTPYANGAFRVKLIFSEDFPRVPPRCNFLTKIFHPNISLNGEVCGNILTDNWHFGLGISHVLMTLRCLLIQPKPESVLNEEAGILFHRSYEDYVRQAKLMTEIHAYCKLHQEEGKPNRKRSGETKERRVNKKCTRRRL